MISHFFSTIKKHRSIILLSFSLLLFACHGILEESTARAAWADLIVSSFVIVLFMSIAINGKSFPIIGMIVAIVAFAMIWLDDIFPRYSDLFRQIEDLTLWFLIGVYVFQSIETLMRQEKIGSEHLSASFALYLLLGIWWGFLYDFIWIVNPKSFSGIGIVHCTLGDFFQYSLSTITTVSTSALIAKEPLVRSLSTIEAVCGQFYFAILIGSLVGAHYNNRSRH